MEIRPVSDLRNKYPEVEKLITRGEAVFLTKNGHGVSVLLSIAEYERLKYGEVEKTKKNLTQDDSIGFDR